MEHLERSQSVNFARSYCHQVAICSLLRAAIASEKFPYELTPSFGSSIACLVNLISIYCFARALRKYVHARERERERTWLCHGKTFFFFLEREAALTRTDPARFFFSCYVLRHLKKLYPYTIVRSVIKSILRGRHANWKMRKIQTRTSFVFNDDYENLFFDEGV